jgi:3-oxoacyl-[acyl-carrier protein] reductase
METGLKGRVAIVAAASQGLGFSVASALAAEGAKLAICSRDEGRIRKAAEKIQQQCGVEILSEALDVTNPEQISNFVSGTTQRFGRLDICVTNAGGPPPKQFLATTDEEWQRAVEA